MTSLELYRDLMDLSEIARLMQVQGIRVDTELVKQFTLANEKAKDLLFPYELKGGRVAALQDELASLTGPFAAIQREKILKKLDKYKVYKDFNPRSGQQIEEYFKANGVELRSTEKKVIQAALEKTAARAAGLNTMAEIEQAEELPPVVQQLYNLFVFKTEGKGMDPWFGPRYMRNGFVHPRFSVTGTSTGRLSSSSPNCQNIPRQGFGEFVRRAIIPRSDDLDLSKADFSNLEFRVCLYLAGTPYVGGDAFKWLLERTGSAFFDVAKKYNPTGYEKDSFKAARDYAKSAVHASDYLEGFVLLNPNELGSYGVQKAIAAGALRIMTREFTPRLRRDWLFFGKVVAFTGANFAERIFGRVDLDTRRQALEIQEDAYMANFWDIREWQIRVLEEVERTHLVRSPTGRFLKLLGMPHDIAKIAIAFLGQGVGADHASGILLRFWREQSRLPLLYVHDELVFEMPKALDTRSVIEYIRLMEGETNRLPGFTCPVEIKRGQNWKDMETIWKDGECK